MKKHTVLIVEDERPLSKVLSLKLSSAGYETEVAHDGQAGLDILKEHKDISLILLDLMMPNMDGFTFLEEMKKMKSKVPVIISSNLSQTEDIERAKSLGAVDFFVKSNSSLSDVIAKVEGILKI